MECCYDTLGSWDDMGRCMLDHMELLYGLGWMVRWWRWESVFNTLRDTKSISVFIRYNTIFYPKFARSCKCINH